MFFKYAKNSDRLHVCICRAATLALAASLALGATPAMANPAGSLTAGSQAESAQQVNGIQLTETNSNGETYLAVASVLAQVSENAAPAMDTISAEVAKKQAKKESKTEKLLAVADSLTGTPYVYGGSTPAGFDCSGFTQYVYAQMGVKLTHNAQAQFNETKSVDTDDMQPGDLVFFGYGTGGISHVGIYVGNGEYIHSPQTGEYVRTDKLSDRSNFVGATRPKL